jgi:hypothetical protein
MPLIGEWMARRAARFGIAALALLAPLGAAADGPWRFDRTIVDAANAGDCKMAGDIDGDGFPDLVIGGDPKEKLVWYQWPTWRKTEVAAPAVEFTTDGALADVDGDGSADWAAHLIGDVAGAIYPDRVEAADLNNDGRVDVVVTEENGSPEGASTWIWLQPPSLADDPGWPRQVLTVQGSTNSLDVADVDLDGKVNILTAEHRGKLRLILWRNLGDARFEPFEIDQGHENHLGARLVDIDGDLDIAGIAFDAAGAVQLWWNDSVLIPGRDQRFEQPQPGVLSALLEKAERVLHRLLP